MTPAADELRAALDTLRVPVRTPAALAEAIYVSLHCRVSARGAAVPGFTNWVGARDFADRLSAANSGSGTWQGGWSTRRTEADGRIVAERHGVRFWVPPAEYRPGAVRIPKEYFELASGFYLAHGNADDTRDVGDTVRVYWHLAPTGAERLVAQTTRRLNQAGIGFQLKVLAEPLRYQRTDPAVLYLARDDCRPAWPILRQIHDDIRPWLRSRVSLLVKRLAPGVGLAEDPGDGSSFGEHRGRLLGEMLADPEWSALGSTAEGMAEGMAERMAKRMALVSSRLARDGYDLDRIYLNPGSRDDFPPLHRDSE